MHSMKFTQLIKLLLVLSISIQNTARADQIEEFHILKAGEKQFYLDPIKGIEIENNSLNRLSLLSENQGYYPAPESACGPIVLLNILIWYQKFGLVEFKNRHADHTIYKRLLFEEIDKRLQKTSGFNRELVNGTTLGHAAMVLDEMVQEGSQNKLRISTELLDAPLHLKNLLKSMPHFRSTYLRTQVVDQETKKLSPIHHAVTLVRVDRSGYITIANWGEHIRGTLRQRPDGQYFVPSNSKYHTLKINGMARFTPFTPVATP